MISLERIEKRFGCQQVLSGVSADFSDGRPVALVGPNGSGKTTLIKCILGLVRPNAGIIRFKGETTGNDYHYRRDLGYMPQAGRFPDQMTVRQVFEMVRNIRTDVTCCDEELIGLFRLEEMFSKRVHTLSGGMRQKMSAALAFLFAPPVLILDEPTAGLDPAAAEMLRDKIRKETAAGKLLLVTSHNLSDLEELTSRLIYLVDGMVRYDDSLDNLKAATGEQRLSRAIARISGNWSTAAPI